MGKYVLCMHEKPMPLEQAQYVVAQLSRERRGVVAVDL